MNIWCIIYLFIYTAGCGHDEFVPMYGSMTEAGKLKEFEKITMEICAEKCTQNKICRSFEWIPLQDKCYLYPQRLPTGKATSGVIFCSSTKKGKILKCQKTTYNSIKYIK